MGRGTRGALISHLDYSRQRLRQVSERLRAQVYPEIRPVEELLVSPQVDRISWDEAQRLDYRPAEPGERFGPLWATYWLRARATVPEAWRGERVDLLWASGSEATLWLDGRVAAGLDEHHAEAALADDARPGELSFQVELACNGLFGRSLGRLAIPYYFCLVSAAGVAGFARFVRGQAQAVWAPTGAVAERAA